MAEREPRIGVRELCRYYADVDIRTVKRWIADGCPHRKVNGVNQFLLSEVIPWREQRFREELRGTGKADLVEEQARKMRADAEISELKAAQMRGELLPASEVRREMERRDEVTRAALLGMRGKYAAQVYGAGSMAEAAEVLDQIARDVVSSLQASADELAAGDEEEVAA